MTVRDRRLVRMSPLVLRGIQAVEINDNDQGKFSLKRSAEARHGSSSPVQVNVSEQK